VSFSIIYREDNSSPDFVNIIAYLHGVFGKAPSAALTSCIGRVVKPDEIGYSIISRVGSSRHNESE